MTTAIESTATAETTATGGRATEARRPRKAKPKPPATCRLTLTISGVP
jgi:hypothetical protein